MKIAILGFGREGKAVLEFLRKSPEYDFARIWILDENPKLKIPKELKNKPIFTIRLKTGKNYLKKLDAFDLVFRSPGIPFNLPEIQRAIKKGTIFSSATKLFFENCSSRIIGVTGTKGKGTTSTLIHEILLRSHLDSFLAGNIGRPALEILPQLKKHSIVVLELSSFQLQDLSVSPQIAVILSIFPDHMDAHATFREYLQAKSNIALYQTANDIIFYFRGDKFSQQAAKCGKGKKMGVVGKADLFKKEDLKIPGEHNFKNAVMAAAVTGELGCPDEVIRETVLNFTGLEHRLEFVRGWNLPLGAAQGKNQSSIDFYNDSASTNPQATIAAIQSFKEPIILIAGGQDKGLDYGSLGKIMRKTSVRLVVLFGANKDKIKKSLKRFPTALCDNLASAVEKAIQHAVHPHTHPHPHTHTHTHNHNHTQTIILFSPGAASFDMFKDYADRGNKFKQIVHNFIEIT